MSSEQQPMVSPIFNVDGVEDCSRITDRSSALMLLDALARHIRAMHKDEFAGFDIAAIIYSYNDPEKTTTAQIIKQLMNQFPSFTTST